VFFYHSQRKNIKIRFIRQHIFFSIKINYLLKNCDSLETNSDIFIGEEIDYDILLPQTFSGKSKLNQAI